MIDILKLLNNPWILIPITMVIIGLILGVYFFFIKRRKERPDIEKEKTKLGLLDKYPVKIIKKRGDSVAIELTSGSVTKSDKQSETPRLKLKNNKELDNFDYTKINNDGEIILVEKPDGQLVYAGLDDELVTATGEGLLRDGYFLNQEWINRSFPEKADKWKNLFSALIIIFGLIAIFVSSYLTYNYYRDLNKLEAQGLKDLNDNQVRIQSSMEIVARTLESITDVQKQIADEYVDIKGILNNRSTG